MLLLWQRKVAVLLALAIFVCGAAAASSPAAENANRALFGNRAVQRELNLSEAQQAKVDAILTETETEIARQLKAAAGNAANDDKLTELEEKIADEVLERQGQRFMALLNPEQRVRFWQVGMQAYGRENAFENNRVQRLLQLTDKQLTEIRPILDRSRTEVGKLAADPKLDTATRNERLQAAKKSCLDRELEVLSEKQRKAFDEIMGKPFDLDLLQTVEGVKPKALTFIFPMRGDSAYFLLSSNEMQRALKISAEQATQIDTILKQADHDMTAVRLSVLKKLEKDFANLSADQKRQTVRAILDGVEPVHHEATRQVLKVLTREQAAKFDEQSLRRLGPRAIVADSVAARLELSNDQKSAVAKLMAQFDEATAPLVVVRRQADLDKSYDAELEKLNTTIRAILTERQRQKLEQTTPK
jgi:hypothetical protein